MKKLFQDKLDVIFDNKETVLELNGCSIEAIHPTYGVDKIYTKAEIEKAKQSPSFPREYELQYLGLVGNVFSQLSIDNATKIAYSPAR